MTYWLNSVVCADCPDCKVPLLPAISRESLQGTGFTPDHGEVWCSTCKRVWRPKPRQEAQAIGQVNLDGPRDVRALRPTLAAPVDARVEPDGTISIATGGGPRVVFTMAELRSLSSALIWLGRGAQGRQEWLRGADRWIFSRNADVHKVAILDESRALEPYRVGIRRIGRTECGACGREIRPGATAYRPQTTPWEHSRVPWKMLRFCPACVEAGGEARVRGPLRSIDGGKAPKRPATRQP